MDNLEISITLKGFRKKKETLQECRILHAGLKE